MWCGGMYGRKNILEVTYMSEILTAIITIVFVYLFQLLKPEWFIGWLLNFLEKKLGKSDSNKIENSLGVKMIETGLYAIKKNEDIEEVKKIVEEIEEKTNELKKSLNFLKME